MNINIISITIITGYGPDKITLHTDLPDGCWPYEGRATLNMSVAADSGVEYCRKHFPDVLVNAVGKSSTYKFDRKDC